MPSPDHSSAPDGEPSSASDGASAVRPLSAPGAVTGLGQLPGQDPRQAARLVLGELGEDPHLPHLPQLPARGPGADPLGRTAALLVDLAVDLQPAGWRFVDAPGRDHHRARAYLANDLDEFAEAADGWRGPVVVALLGPWSLLGGVELTRGELAASDHGARRDVVTSLAEGVAAHVADVRRLVPGAGVVVQLDEPSVPAVLAGRLPTASGYGTLRAVHEPEVRAGLTEVLDAVRRAGAEAVVRVAAEDAPFALLREAGARAIALDVTSLDARAWESVAASVEDGVRLWAGVLDPGAPLRPVAELLDVLRGPWRRVGLPAALLADVLLTPTTGLAGLAPDDVRPLLRRLRETGSALQEASAD